MLRSSCLTATTAVLMLLLAPVAASADSYLVTSCTDPLGQPNAAVGWVPFSTPGGTTMNTCAGPNGALVAALPAANPPGNATANWRFDAPLGTRIVRVLARRATSGVEGGPPPQPKDVAYDMTAGNQILEDCAVAPDSSCVGDLTAPLDKQGLNGAFVQFRVLCTNAGLACTRKLGVVATHVWVALEDQLPPAVANARVTDDGETSGVLRVRFDAADVGGGVYRALVKVDGKVAQTIALGPPPCSDVAPADADPYQFTVPVPCPPIVRDVTAAVDVRSLPAGPHGVEIAVEDAAGNETSVLGPIEFPKPNVGVAGSSAEVQAALRGRLRMWFVKSRTGDRRRYTSRFGTRVVTRGVLRTRRGRGIVGARIDVYHIRRDGKRRLVKTGLKSRGGGALTLILPLDVDTRTIEYAYRALRPGPITSRQRLRLTVRTKSGRIYYRKSRARR